MTQTIKVRVTGYDHEVYAWYAEVVGDVIDVIDVTSMGYYRSAARPDLVIPKEYCEIVSPAHKHDRVIIAIAEGKLVQYACPGTDYSWVDYKEGDVNNPLFQHHWAWRIKPEYKPDVVRYMHMPTSLSIAQPTYCRDIEYGNLKLTFDGETGELKDAQRY